jgi:hypothetical protein
MNTVKTQKTQAEMVLMMKEIYLLILIEMVEEHVIQRRMEDGQMRNMRNS